MPLPNDVIDSIFTDYVHGKQHVVEHIVGGPVTIGMRWAMDFGTQYRDWPYFDMDRLRTEFELSIPIDMGSDEPVLAIFDTDGNRDNIFAYVSKLLTFLGPPRWVAVCMDAYRITPTPDELIKMIAEGIRDGELARRREQLDESVSDILACTALHADGDAIALEQSYIYDDDGKMVIGERDTTAVRPTGGFINTLMQSLVEMSGKTPYETLVHLAGGDEAEAQRIIAARAAERN